MTSKPTFNAAQKMLAWGVHVFTASGLLAAFMAILAVQAHDWRMAMFWLLVALLIDGVDGTFARLWNVASVLPQINGKTIDYVIDFATYAIIPVYMIYEAAILPSEWNLAGAFLMLLVSALYYGKVGMVSDDLYFVGFPVMWNMVAFCLVLVFDWSPWVNLAWVLFFAVLHFVPIKFAYPSQQTTFRSLTLLVTVVFLATVCGAVYLYPQSYQWVRWSVTLCAVYYGILGVYTTWKV